MRGRPGRQVSRRCHHFGREAGWCNSPAGDLEGVDMRFRPGTVQREAAATAINGTTTVFKRAMQNMKELQVRS